MNYDVVWGIVAGLITGISVTVVIEQVTLLTLSDLGLIKLKEENKKTTTKNDCK